MFKNYTIEQFNASISTFPVYVRDEIGRYGKDNIYFIGKEVKRKIYRNKVVFDDEYGRYILFAGENLDYRYEILNYFGQGMFGVVISAYDHKSKKRVAIKVTRRVSNYRKYFIEEIINYEYINNCLKYKCKELIRMISYFMFRGHFCIVFDICSEDLHAVLKKVNGRNYSLPMNRLQPIVASMTKGLLQIHELNLIHGDFKLDNIAFQLGSTNEVTLLDLGNAKFGNQKKETKLQAIYYRSPEIILQLGSGASSDVWALGCIVYQMATGQVLFKGATDEQQMIEFMEVIGVPPLNMVKKSNLAAKYFRSNGAPIYCTRVLNGEYTLGNQRTMGSKCHPGTRDSISILRNHCPDLADFIHRCVVWEPERRISAKEALCHKFLIRRAFPPINLNALQGLPRNTGVQLSLSSCNVLEMNKKKKKLLKKTKSLVHVNNNTTLDIHMEWLMIQAKYFH